jgi:uncharacterized membrane protein
MQRYRFIDHYRGWAVITMIETHSFNAWLADQYRPTIWYQNLKFVNGFVAPSFLFLAGVAFMIVARKREFNFFNSNFLRQLRRFLWILVLGYLLHFPVIQRQHGHYAIVHMAEFYKVDVLQAIAIGLIVLLLVTAAFHQLSRVALVSLGLAAATMLASPFMWTHSFDLHPFWLNYLNGKQTGLFPLFPWSAFLFAGATTAYYFFSRDGRAAMWHIAIAGLILILLGFFTRNIEFFPSYSFWLDSPQWMMMRIGIVLELFALFYALEQLGVSGMQFVHWLGTQSLFAYIVHLEILFNVTGSMAHIPLFMERSLPPGETFALYCVLLLVTALLTWMWSAVKHR